MLGVSIKLGMVKFFAIAWIKVGYILSYLAADQVEEQSNGLKAVMQVEAEARLKGNSL